MHWTSRPMACASMLGVASPSANRICEKAPRPVLKSSSAMLEAKRPWPVNG